MKIVRLAVLCSTAFVLVLSGCGGAAVTPPDTKIVPTAPPKDSSMQLPPPPGK